MAKYSFDYVESEMAPEQLLHHRLDCDLARDLDMHPKGFSAGLAEYLRARDSHLTLFDPTTLPRIEDLAASYDPAGWGWERRIADEAVAGRVCAATDPHSERFTEYPPGFNFTSFPDKDPQAIMGLCRHRWFASLARAYWHRREVKYLDALWREWDFFTERAPAPLPGSRAKLQSIYHSAYEPPYLRLDMSIRLMNWYWAFWLSVHAPETTPEQISAGLARSIKLFDMVASIGVGEIRSNHDAMQFEALFLWAASLPELVGMDTWRHACRNILEASLTAAVLPDGIQYEMSPHYHALCISSYGIPAYQARRMGEPMADYSYEILKRMGEATDAMQCPDGNDPPIGDSDRTPSSYALSIIKLLHPDFTTRRPCPPTYLSVWVGGGKTWDSRTSAVKARTSLFASGGFACAATEAGSDASFAILRNGANSEWHAHYDNLSLYWEAFGMPALTDPGRYLYVDDFDRIWVRHAESHNSVLPAIAGVGMRSSNEGSIKNALPGDPRMDPVEAEDRGDFMVLRSGHRLFTGCPDAFAVRTVFLCGDSKLPWVVVIDDLKAPHPIAWVTSWLIPGADPLERAPGGWRIAVHSTLQLAMTALDNDATLPSDEERFWTPAYGQIKAARWLRFTSKERRAAQQAWAWTAAKPPPAVMPRLSREGNGICLWIGDRTWKLS